MFNPAHIYTNRGASGIDGLIATAAGVAAKADPTQPTTVLLGDTSALFDLNSLALLRSLNSPFVLIIINNDGGNIFHMLPVPEHNQIREHFYQLPHGLNFPSQCRTISARLCRTNGCQPASSTIISKR